MRDLSNLNKWKKELNKHQLLYPDERVVSFINKYFSEREKNENLRALDIGFSSGRHLSLLRDYCFETYGIDYNEEAVKIARNLFGENIIDSSIFAADIADKPFPKDFFDVVLYYGVAFLRSLDGMRKDLSTVNAMMKSGGKMIVNFRTKDNWFFGRGTSDNSATYLLDESAGAYKGMTYTFLDLEDAKNLLQETGFNVQNFELMELSKNNLVEKHSWYIFWVEKP